MSKKSIRNIIIICILLAIILIIYINVAKKSDTNIQGNEGIDENYRKSNIIVREHYGYNEFEYYNISTEQLLATYLNEYKYDCANDMQAAYNSLDKDYREKKFGTFEEYAQYLNNEFTNTLGARIKTYKINNYDGYTEYILKDQNDNVYIFKATAVMEYTLFLDEYTVPTPSFIKEYNEAKDEEKAGINLNRFLESIENKDYKYAYSKLYSTFKEKNFQTQTDFENYININWLNYDNIETVDVENQSGVYVCKLKITNENNEEVEKAFMIQLENNAEYQVSFEI